MKIATYVNTPKNSQTLFKILINKKPKDQMIVLGMGEKGKITRVLGPLLGSYLTFASTDTTNSAPGQININELTNIYKVLNYKFLPTGRQAKL